jgi:hypothetical protein
VVSFEKLDAGAFRFSRPAGIRPRPPFVTREFKSPISRPDDGLIRAEFAADRLLCVGVRSSSLFPQTI